MIVFETFNLLCLRKHKTYTNKWHNNWDYNKQAKRTYFTFWKNGKLLFKLSN